IHCLLRANRRLLRTLALTNRIPRSLKQAAKTHMSEEAGVGLPGAEKNVQYGNPLIGTETYTAQP
ncbi:MAG: hypothetical protein JXA25_18900, partial [Anaerolineales bacterium]|nr:hypothetical protein [Anaerolineales bacterium]